MLVAAAPTRIDTALARLDAWLDTVRGPGGYGGPVAHWWQQSLIYTGAGLDWRYEGIIAGYLRLWERTGAERWLAKACRAGDDLLAGQMVNGHFVASAFEINPATGGTPHEAACVVGLLLLAQALRQARRPGWELYSACAERNLAAFAIGQLWDAGAQSFRDSPALPSFVPNKAATACEALFLLAELTGQDRWVERYALPNLDAILAHQVNGEGALDGAIAQNSLGARRIARYFPLYIARCVPALLHGYAWTRRSRYLGGALRAMAFIARWTPSDGRVPTVVYPNRRASAAPAWIAALGDILRAADALRPYGFNADLSAVEARLLAGQTPGGGIRTATGFAEQAGGRRGALPDFRDLLPVAGWCDKAFRYLASRAGPLPEAASAPYAADCLFGGRPLRYHETPELIEVRTGREVRYRWRKGADRPEIATKAFWLR